jgi:large subunit ribosomal protein L6
MSRIGKRPIDIPSGVSVAVDGSVIKFKKGNIEKTLDTMDRVGIAVEGNQVTLSLIDGIEGARAFWGTYRALANNIVVGLDKGFEKKLDIVGVGYRAAVKGKDLELLLGFSHPVIYPIPEGINIAVEGNSILIKGADKQQVGQIASELRGYRPPEPYKGKGVKYSGEKIIRKAGKASKK